MYDLIEYCSTNQVSSPLAYVIIIFHASQSLIDFSASVTHPTYSHFISPSNISFHCCFPVFLQSFQLSQDVLVCLFSSHGQKRLPCVNVFYLWVILFSTSYNILLYLISLQSMRFSIGNTFLLPPVCFVTVLKLSRPLIHSFE